MMNQPLNNIRRPPSVVVVRVDSNDVITNLPKNGGG